MHPTTEQTTHIIPLYPYQRPSFWSAGDHDSKRSVREKRCSDCVNERTYGDLPPSILGIRFLFFDLEKLILRSGLVHLIRKTP